MLGSANASCTHLPGLAETYLLFLELPCLPFPANCFSRHNPTHTGPSPTWRAERAKLGSGAYNGADGEGFYLSAVYDNVLRGLVN